MTVNAIETRYAGCRFRSRLEARWAVFFDSFGVDWDYEPQGYLISSYAGDVWSGPYLPDFKIGPLPVIGLHGQAWFEVKGHPAVDDVRQVAAACIPHGGLPALNNYGSVVYLAGPFSPDGFALDFLEFIKGDVYWHGQIVASDSGSFDTAVAARVVEAWQTPRSQSPLLAPAVRAARSARFEHGEVG